ncbi:PP2C-like domain-containing protein [Pseudolycoriella hygida]|uniref:PP2C-like domain-containing protein n=1 Tax=Pseudolycoriella hygida TaxID=35572 RepID=A0A9Q0RUV2_9DIPT|nr:PP2C-like domain-containing protein [Pseudolycoriella hygida]
MPSLRQRMTTYFRQLSFIAEPREDSRLAASLSPRNRSDDGSFITKYLEGKITKTCTTSAEIQHGKDPNDLPDIKLQTYETGPQTITAACTGPDEGLTGVKRSRLHLSAGPDIDFIDTIQDVELDIRRSSNTTKPKQFSRFRSDQNANKPFTRSRKGSKSHEQQVEAIGSDVKNEKATINVIVSLVSTTTTDKSMDTSKSKIEKSMKLASGDLNRNRETGTEVVTTSNSKDIMPNRISQDISLKEEEQLNNCTVTNSVEADVVAGVSNWKQDNDHAYGMAVSLYEKNYLTKEQAGSPIADCYGLVVRGNSAAMAIADGVNWGEGARLAARSAVQGSLEYLDTALFGQVPGGMATSTREVFVSLLRSFWEAHACILEIGGSLTTLTVAVVLPLQEEQTNGKFVVCVCNVGDSFGYVYSKENGVREITQGSHDITSMRDIRDAMGALGPVDGNKPELENLTLSLTIVDCGDIVFLTSDGISDNFDPVVGKFAEPFSTEALQMPTQQLAAKRQNKSTSAIQSTSTNRFSLPPIQAKPPKQPIINNTSSVPIRPPRHKKQTSITHTPVIASNHQTVTTSSSRPKFLRSHTVIEPRNSLTKTPVIKYPKSAAGLPLVTGPQRHALTLLRLEDLLCYGINGALQPCLSARNLCHLLIDFAKMITSAKRNILEQRELFYRVTTNANGVKREEELTKAQQRYARKRIVEGTTFLSLPGKLDHASVVAFTVGTESNRNSIYNETDF